jgi:hypothetical protein
MKKSNTLLELKQTIGEKLGLGINEFVVKRNNIHRELKNMSAKLLELGLYNGCLVKVEKGTPH